MNSMEYLLHAVELPVDALEIDIRRDSHGRLVLTHDAAENSGLLTLEQAFAVIATCGLSVNCDLKEYDLEQDVMAAASAAGISENRVLFSGSVRPRAESDWPENITPDRVYLNIEELVPNIYLPLERGEQPLHADLVRAVELCRETGCRVINVNFRICTPEFCKLCAVRGLGISMWTPSTTKDLTAAAKLMPVNITSRRPLLAKEIVQELM